MCDDSFLLKVMRWCFRDDKLSLNRVFFLRPGQNNPVIVLTEVKIPCESFYAFMKTSSSMPSWLNHWLATWSKSTMIRFLNVLSSKVMNPMDKKVKRHDEIKSDNMKWKTLRKYWTKCFFSWQVSLCENYWVKIWKSKQIINESSVI